MTKKFVSVLAMLAVVIMSATLFGCASLALPNENAPDNQSEMKFGSDILCGFFLEFYDESKNAITSNDFESDQAIKNYYKVTAVQDENGCNSYYKQYLLGGNVFSDVKSHLYVKDTGERYEFECTIFYTSKLVRGIMYVNDVNYNEDTLEPCLGNSRSGVEFSADSSGSTSLNQSLSVSKKVNGVDVTKTYDATFKINFQFIDDLVGVKIYEYDNDGNLLLTSNYVKGQDYTASEDCVFAVVEEQYLVTASNSHNNTQYCVRTVIDRPSDGGAKAKSKTLHYPTGNGFVETCYLSVNFS